MFNFSKLFLGTRKSTIKAVTYDGNVVKKKVKNVCEFIGTHDEIEDVLYVCLHKSYNKPFLFKVTCKTAIIRKVDSTRMIIESGGKSVHLIFPTERQCDHAFIEILYRLHPHKATFKFVNCPNLVT